MSTEDILEELKNLLEISYLRNLDTPWLCIYASMLKDIWDKLSQYPDEILSKALNIVKKYMELELSEALENILYFRQLPKP